MTVRILWVRAMECMCAQTRPRFILSPERVDFHLHHGPFQILFARNLALPSIPSPSFYWILVFFKRVYLHLYMLVLYSLKSLVRGVETRSSCVNQSKVKDGFLSCWITDKPGNDHSTPTALLLPHFLSLDAFLPSLDSPVMCCRTTPYL